MISFSDQEGKLRSSFAASMSSRAGDVLIGVSNQVRLIRVLLLREHTLDQRQRSGLQAFLLKLSIGLNDFF